jgi:S1-C subfamily serine protease
MTTSRDVSGLKDRGEVGSILTRMARIAISLMVGLTLSMVVARANGGQAVSDSQGSVDDYINDNPDFRNSYRVPSLGIQVRNGTGTLEGRYPFDGIEVLSVAPGSPSATAGLQGGKPQLQAALTVGLVAAAFFFPPAMVGVAALESSGIGKSNELIIAVDGRRTRNVTDFGEAISEAQAGEIVYLTVVSNGERRQARVTLPGELR